LRREALDLVANDLQAAFGHDAGNRVEMLADGARVRIQAIERDEPGNAGKQCQQDVEGDAGGGCDQPVFADAGIDAKGDVLPALGGNFGWTVGVPPALSRRLMLRCLLLEWRALFRTRRAICGALAATPGERERTRGCNCPKWRLAC